MAVTYTTNGNGATFSTFCAGCRHDVLVVGGGGQGGGGTSIRSAGGGGGGGVARSRSPQMTLLVPFSQGVRAYQGMLMEEPPQLHQPDTSCRQRFVSCRSLQTGYLVL